MANSKIREFENICRTCMAEQKPETIPTTTRKKAKVLIPIYQEHEAKNYGHVNIIELLEQTSPQLTVEADDMLPKNICESCLDMLVDIHEFQKKSLRVEQRLKDIIKQYYPALVDPLNSSTIQDGVSENIKIEIDEPVNTPIYLCVEEFDTEDDGGGKWKPQFDTAASEARDNENDNLLEVMFWKYIEGDYQDAISTMKEQTSKREGFVDGEVDSRSKHRLGREEKRLDKRTRILRKSNREHEIAEEISQESNTRKQDSDNENVDREWGHQSTIAISNDMEEVADDESLASEESDCNEIIVGDDSEWEPSLDKSERFKSKSIKKVSKLVNNQQDNLNLKYEDKGLVCPKLDSPGFSCNECGKHFKSRLRLKSHLKSHIKNIQEQHSTQKANKCPECGVFFKTRYTLKRHLYLHEKDETKIKYKCQYCDRGLSSSSALRCHERTHTGERPYLCSICGKSFTTAYSLYMHSLIHTGELKYQCPECPRKFRCGSNMYTHKAIVHSTVRPHVCDVCGASFKKPNALTKHQRNHGEKKHKCDYCEMKFAQPDQCRQHMRRHTGEKSYKCRYCESSFSQSHERMKHLRAHLGDNVYRCELCPQAFRKLRELREHFILHNDDDEETKIQNLNALKEEEERIQAKIKREKATV